MKDLQNSVWLEHEKIAWYVVRDYSVAISNDSLNNMLDYMSSIKRSIENEFYIKNINKRVYNRQ